MSYWSGLSSVLARQDFQWLGKERRGTCLSLYVPFRILLKGDGRPKPAGVSVLVGRVREWLMARGQSAVQVRRLLEPLRQVEEDASFWKWPGEGLAYFSSAGSFRLYQLAFPVAQRIAIGGHLETSPIILSQGFASRYYVLALGQEGARLLECSHQGFRRIQSDLACGPRSDGCNGLLGRFREADHRLAQLLSDHPVPLILFAPPDLARKCRSVSAYSGLTEQVIETQLEEVNDSDLHKRAWFAAESVLARSFESALRTFKRNSTSPQASTAPEEIWNASLQGRVRFLFAACESERMSRQPMWMGCKELIESCALQALSRGGKVFAVDPDAVPGGGCMAALFR